MKKDKIILGIDPGTNIMGYGAIHIIGKEIKLLGAGIISMEKLKDQPLKMKKIFEATSDPLATRLGWAADAIILVGYENGKLSVLETFRCVGKANSS